MTTPSELNNRWNAGVVLKRDLLSTVERGRFVTPAGEVGAVLRRIDEVPWWSVALARHLLGRERRALAAAGAIGIGPRILFGGRISLVRSWIDGLPLHLAKPYGDCGYFRSAKAALRALHRAGICHNDLAKEQNWLRGADGCAYLTDFQLAMRFSHRTWLFRIAAYEDLRHLLKHKQRYAPAAVTPAERRVLGRKSLPTRLWMASGKRVYYWVTRGVFGFTDREGGGTRLVRDAPLIAARLKTHPQVRETVVLAFPDRRAGTGLYAFVEAAPGVAEQSLREFIADSPGAKPPEHLQVTNELPRRASGEIRNEILQLVAMNQLDQIDTLVTDDRERTLVASIVADRRNLRDRFSF
jgi:AMP-binding enzyme C-terminal domain